ncbi:acyl-CoA dehydrogenase family protein [Spirillospora sp. NPDC047279]|uniref:acyl-CoA dehydrogenase family protein n=1 Tax=Spirillospora sp. NPDC047279 TaxID=3155478 RepID=UPI0033F2E2EE
MSESLTRDQRERHAGGQAPPSGGWGEVLAAGWPTAPAPPELPPLDAGVGAAGRILAAAAGDLAVLPIPAEFGGGGGDLPRAASAQRNLGLADPSVAVALNMHMLSIGLMAEHWRRERDGSWMLLEAIAGGHDLVGSAFAEPGGSPNILRSTTRAVRTGSGFRLTGVKFPCSLASAAKLFCLSAQVVDEDRTIVALCPAEAPGLKVTGGWPSLGMCASDTARLELTDVEIDRRLVFHEAPAGTVDDVVIGGLVWFVVLISATYHGVLSALVELTAAAPPRLPRPTREAALTAAAAELVAFGSACQGLGDTWTRGLVAGDAALVSAAALRLRLSTTTDRVLSDLRPLLGAAAYTDGTPAAGRVLDAMAAHHHPPSLPLCESLITAAGTGRPLSLDLRP